MPQLLRLRFLICFRACRQRLSPLYKKTAAVRLRSKFLWILSRPHGRSRMTVGSRSFDFALTGSAQDDTIIDCFVALRFLAMTSLITPV